MQWNENLRTADQLVQMARQMDPTLAMADFTVHNNTSIHSWQFKTAAGTSNEDVIKKLLHPIWIKLVIRYELMR